MRTNTQGIQEKVSFCTNCNTLVTDCATCKHGYVPDPTNSDAQQKCAGETYVHYCMSNIEKIENLIFLSITCFYWPLIDTYLHVLSLNEI